MQKFIVAYSSSKCDIEAEYYSTKHYDYTGTMKYYYENGLSRYFDKKYGDVVGWNNQFWCAVEADNAKDALDVFMKKLEEYFYKKE